MELLSRVISYQAPYSKYGKKAFEYKVIRRYNTSKEALAAEFAFITKSRKEDFVLYNATNGGECGGKSK